MTEKRKLTIFSFTDLKKQHVPIVSLTAYDYFTAKYLDEAGVDLILVGDSVEMVLYGSETTLSATMQKMLYHTEAVARAVKHAFVSADMPFLSYQGSINDAVINAGKFLQVGAQAVKIEGGKNFANVAKAMIESGIPVLGHIGMLPQSVNELGGYRTQGKSEAEAERLIEDALMLQDVGVFALVIEKTYSETAARITEAMKIPTIGIGSGPHCDGQILVLNDILGLYDKFMPPFARKYTDLKSEIIKAASQFAEDVRNKKFP